jgi:hypothetical protein
MGWDMAKRRKKKGQGSLRTRVLTGVVLGTVAVLFAIALIAYLQNGNWQRPPGELASRMGRINHMAARGSVGLLGVVGSVLLALGLGALAARFLAGRKLPFTGRRALLVGLGVAVLAGALAALPGGQLSAGRALFAGAVGVGLVRGLEALFGGIGAVVVLLGASAAFLATIGIPIFSPLARLVPPLRAGLSRVAAWLASLGRSVREAFPAAEPEPAPDPRVLAGAEDDPGPGPEVVRASRPRVPAPGPADDDWEGGAADAIRIERSGAATREAAEPDRAADEADTPRDVPPAPAFAHEAGEGEDRWDAEEPDAGGDVPVVVLPPAGEPAPPPPPDVDPVPADILESDPPDEVEPYQRPPADFLEQEEEDPDEDAVQETLVESAKVLERTLKDFGVKGKVTRVQPGPVITRYEIEPAPGQKVAPIANLSDDLALALRARSIRVVAPIPGKAAVGIEVPNANPRVVRLGSLLETPEYREVTSPLNLALGRTISGEPFCAALDRMPHVLVAGATGSGKSVCINTIITSLIYNAGPDEVRFLMVDPKMLELMSYAGLPHVIPPIVTQAKEAAKVLKWAVGEMEARYRTLAHVGVRNIADYNRRQEKEDAPRMPYLVVIVDELADLMLSSHKSEIEDQIARLAQMARAVGIHLVVATQRPSVDVITGVIKANFPSRIAFQVPTRTDSRTILDSIGAEKLLGRGDMLYLGVGMSEPIRVHGSFVSTEETNDIVEWLKNRNPRPTRGGDDDDQGPITSDKDDLYPREREDDLFEEAARILVQHQQGSISLLQRRLKVGYARAARLVDMMEEAGIVGPFTGSKARDILVPNVEELEKRFAASRGAPLSGN